ncbi:EPIDERMAL PATTERNING FACTOR-like protein [Quillaja saponaria]|uniref:Epidermal patterning factor-like protein n=1 Tax=Quillaja saponaria TaxID=32244 RepID=A0AAD7VL59_QUISA|nr:EPIDERMAL PATTERNING FACTOR-like protein [Quillaja saponaria]
MGVHRHRHRHRQHHLNHRLQTLTAFTFLLFSSVSALTLTQPSKPKNQNQPIFFQRELNQLLKVSIRKISGHRVVGLQNEEEKPNGSVKEQALTDQKRYGRPGSWPPSCTSKCGLCSPCKPVHVPVHPGLSIPLEYYPEAWRCKCGNKLFMP